MNEELCFGLATEGPMNEEVEGPTNEEVYHHGTNDLKDLVLCFLPCSRRFCSNDDVCVLNGQLPIFLALEGFQEYFCDNCLPEKMEGIAFFPVVDTPFPNVLWMESAVDHLAAIAWSNHLAAITWSEHCTL